MRADVTVVSGKRQVIPSLVGVASSAELLGLLAIADDGVKHVSSTVAHALTSAIDAAVAAAEAKHISKHLYVTSPVKDIDRTSTLPFSSANQSEAAQPLILTTKSCLSGIVMPCDECNTEGLSSATSVPGWE